MDINFEKLALYPRATFYECQKDLVFAHAVPSAVDHSTGSQTCGEKEWPFSRAFSLLFYFSEKEKKFLVVVKLMLL